MSKSLYLYTILGALIQVEFPARADFERASEDKGALHLRPNSTLYLTNDELAHIKAKYPQVLRCMQGPLDPEPIAEEKPAEEPTGEPDASSEEDDGEELDVDADEPPRA